MRVEFLYKYGELGDHSEQFFSGANIWFSRPKDLNDPFECRPWFTFEGSRDDIVKALAREIRRREQGITPHEATAQAVGIFLDGRHNSPETWNTLRDDVRRLLGENIGLFCTSRSPDNILMWSHYSKDHSGFCVEFEATDNTPVFGAAQPVLYSDEYPVVDFFRTPKEKQADLVFLTKYTGWAYEQEWRIIDYENGSGPREYSPEMMKRVIFGIRMPAADRETIKTWLKKRKHPVALAETVQNERSFAVDIRSIADA